MSNIPTSRPTRFLSVMGAAALLMAGATSAGAQTVNAVRLSVSTTGEQANAASAFEMATPDGRAILFSSNATNLVAGSNGSGQIFLRDRDTDRDGVFDEPGAVRTIRVAEGMGGQQSTDLLTRFDLSPDGRFVLFTTASPLDADARTVPTTPICAIVTPMETASSTRVEPSR